MNGNNNVQFLKLMVTVKILIQKSPLNDTGEVDP